jgi:hypothetical protein
LLIKCLFSPAHPLNNFTQQFLLSNKGFDSWSKLMFCWWTSAKKPCESFGI